MKNLITCLVVCVFSSVVAAEIHHVPADFPTIQYAIDAAVDGDEIIVAPGTYTSTAYQVIDMRGKEIWLHSSAGAEVTIIDGEGTRRGITCNSGETSSTVIEGFTITNNTGYNGGGMYNSSSSPTLTDCTFENNIAAFGGGMFCEYNSSPTLTNCTFTENTADYGGGGMYNSISSPTLDNCTFTNNSADNGGGMSNNGGNPTLTDCTFTNNTADFWGGGMYNYNYSNPTLTNCTFENNSALDGGGMYNTSNSSPALTNTTVCGNTPDQIIGDWIDNGGNTVADVCPECPDINGDGIVDVSDLLTIIDQWGLSDSTADVNDDGIVDVSDLLIVISNWGECE